MSEQKEATKQTVKMVVIPVEDFKFLEGYIQRINVGYDMIEAAAKVKQIIQNAQVGDIVPKPK